MILNLTQHNGTVDQYRAGLVDPADDLKQRIQKQLTFDHMPTADVIGWRASILADLASVMAARYEIPYHQKTRVMIGGAPFLMPLLERELRWRGFAPVYSFSRREVKEYIDDDGQQQKRSVFKHVGFIEAVAPNSG